MRERPLVYLYIMDWRRKDIVLLVFFLAFFMLWVAVGAGYLLRRSGGGIRSPVILRSEKPLDRYTIDTLGKREYQGSQIVLEESMATTSAYTVYRFSFLSDSKKVTGQAHIPRSATEENKKPVVVQFRGYIDREKYQTGDGTRRSAEVFATNGFISLAPDFLGYGGSDMPSNDVFEERFQTYTTALAFLASIKTLPMADPDRIGIWGHSNGGQIALTILEVLRTSFPTTLWAPVTKPFPYSILYYTDEATDRGKFLRKRLAKFEEDYDVELFSMPNYLDRISAPLQVHQGTADGSVPKKWSDELTARLKELGKDVNYFVYPGADHNMVGAWNTVVGRDIEFFRKHLRHAMKLLP